MLLRGGVATQYLLGASDGQAKMRESLQHSLDLLVQLQQEAIAEAKRTADGVEEQTGKRRSGRAANTTTRPAKP